MRHAARWAVVALIVGLLVAGPAGPARAIYPQLSTRLAGPAIGGRVPEGDAKLDQSRLPGEPGRLEVRVKNVNLPDGTVLTVNLGRACGGCPVGTGVDVGTIRLSRGEGQTTASVAFPVGRTEPIAVKRGDAVVLSGGAPWQV